MSRKILQKRHRGNLQTGLRFQYTFGAMTQPRWSFLFLLALLPVFARAKEEPVEINFQYIARVAEERAAKPFRSPRLDLPDVLRADQLDYDKYREIEFRHDFALWRGE